MVKKATFMFLVFLLLLTAVGYIVPNWSRIFGFSDCPEGRTAVGYREILLKYANCPGISAVPIGYDGYILEAKNQASDLPEDARYYWVSADDDDPAAMAEDQINWYCTSAVQLIFVVIYPDGHIEYTGCQG